MSAPLMSQETCVAKLITQIEKMLAENNVLIKVIRRPQTLLAALRELDTIIEMQALKKDIVEQILSYCIHKHRQNKSMNKVLHFCNYGNPGTGKTYASKIIAKIYYALGCVEFSSHEHKEKKEDPHQAKWRFLDTELKTLTQDLDIIRKNYFLLKERHYAKKVVKSTSASIIGRNPVVRTSSGEDSWKAIEQALTSTEETLTASKNITEILLHTNTPDVKEDKEDNPDVDEKVYCVVCGRNELVAKFMGQTAGQTYDFLMANRGKTIIIEEAYVLWTGERDIMGFEALVEIHRFMDEHPDEAIIGFNGYEKLLLETIFKIQPGLQGRINNFYYMKGYTPRGLASIFTKQVRELNMNLQDIDLCVFFEQYSMYFPSYGRDTLRLVRQLETTHIAATFYLFCVDASAIANQNFILTKEVFDAAVKTYIDSAIGKQSPKAEIVSSRKHTSCDGNSSLYTDY